MAVPSYQRLDLDLAIARSQTPVILTGQPIKAIKCAALPAGSIASFSLQPSGQQIPLATGDSWDTFAELNGCFVGSDEGLFITNPAGAGILTLIVSFGFLRHKAVAS